MSELDLTEAIEAAALAISQYDWNHGISNNGEISKDQRREAKAALEAAAPILERQVREKVALELAEWADTFKDDHDNDAASHARRTLRRHIGQCATRVAPKMTIQEVAEALERGDYVACYLDDAGQSIARGGQP